MPTLARVTSLSAIGFLIFIPTACAIVPQSALRQCQCRALTLQQELCQEREQWGGDRARLEQSLAAANQRLDNLQAERAQLHQRYISLLNKAGQPSPLSAHATERLKELQKRYPEFEFDPITGVSKFHSDILFDTGSADIKQSAHNLLHEFAQIMNDGEAEHLKILVVGHTDDRPIVKQHTKVEHPTNWHLSTDRADSVVLALTHSGIKPNRMGAAGYSMYQPLEPNRDEATRQKNRRVEIFVLAPDATIAGWDPASCRN